MISWKTVVATIAVLLMSKYMAERFFPQLRPITSLI